MTEHGRQSVRFKTSQFASDCIKTDQKNALKTTLVSQTHKNKVTQGVGGEKQNWVCFGGWFG